MMLEVSGQKFQDSFRTSMKGKSQLRRYFSKKIDLSVYPQSELDKGAMRLHQRPGKTLGFETPARTLQASVASAG
jgi:IS30 family transposase